MVTWQWAQFEDLKIDELYEILALREQVFIVEQNCVHQDVDLRDKHAWHLLGWVEQDQQRKLAAYARLVSPGNRFAEPSIGRVVTNSLFRRCGYGKLLMIEAIEKAKKIYPGAPIRISAQQWLERFYQGVGFETVSEPYLEDGIPHIEMLRVKDNGKKVNALCLGS